MMDWLKRWLRKWLGIDGDKKYISEMVAPFAGEIDQLWDELEALRSASCADQLQERNKYVEISAEIERLRTQAQEKAAPTHSAPRQVGHREFARAAAQRLQEELRHATPRQ